MGEIGDRNLDGNLCNSYGDRTYRETLKSRQERPWGQLQPGYPEYAPKELDYITGRVIKPKE